MNYLAHLLLSTRAIDYQLGNLLADPLKGRAWPESTAALREGMQMHSRIDIFTDSHAQVLACKARLGESGRLRGVVLDVYFDHLLYLHWSSFAALDPESFIEQFEARALARAAVLPSRPATIVKNIVNYRVLWSYSEFGGVETALKRIDSRLPPRIAARESLSQYLPNLRTERSAIEKDFLSFFPDLVEAFKNTSGVDARQHWLR